jgi:hypothetical protein
MLKKSLSQGCWHVLAPLFVFTQKADSGCRQPRYIQGDIRYCGNLIWVMPAKGKRRFLLQRNALFALSLVSVLELPQLLPT